MGFTVKHPFTSAKADGVDPTIVQPSNWNANHTLTGVLMNYIGGLTLSTAGSSATATIAAGEAASSDNTDIMTLASSVAKTTASWVAGAGGALDTGVIAINTWYHVFLIKNPTSGVVDVLFSTNVSAPTMPSGYTLKRRIGSMKTNGSSQWTSFTQLGDRFLWAVESIDVAANSTLANSSAQLTTLSVPTGVQVVAEFIINPGYNSTIDYWLITSPDQVDSTPTSALNDVKFSVSFIGAYLPLYRRTNTSGQIRLRAINSGGGSPTGGYGILTQGWIDLRGT